MLEVCVARAGEQGGRRGGGSCTTTPQIGGVLVGWELEECVCVCVLYVGVGGTGQCDTVSCSP